MKTERRWILPLLLFSAVLLLFCSMCSPMYPINIWDDANCIFTVGRAVRSGAVMYRDIYEQKGPVLYFINAAGAFLSDTDFSGVYVMETLSLTAALYAAFCMMRRRLKAETSFLGAALFGTAAVVSSAFCRGNSAEEFCLPLLMGAVCMADSGYSETWEPVSTGKLFVCGLCAGIVASVKYTILGLFIGFCLAEGIAAWRKEGFPRAVRSGAVFLAGMLLPIAAWCLYFASQNALEDFFRAYLYNNVFLYEGGNSGLRVLVRTILEAFAENLVWSVPAVLGIFCVLFRERGARRLSLFLMAGSAFLTVFVLGKTWDYSSLVLTVFAVPFLRELLGFAEQRIPCGKKAWTALCSAAVLLLLGSAWAVTPNAFLRGKDKAELAQYRMAEMIPEESTLLQYTHLDDGFYLASGHLPEEKYFVRLNVSLGEMEESLTRQLEEKTAEYVVTSWEPLPEKYLETYQLIARDAGYDGENRMNKGFWLYRRWSDESLEIQRQRQGEE